MEYLIYTVLRSQITCESGVMDGSGPC